MQHSRSLVASCELLVEACGIYFPDQGSNLDLLHWEHRVLGIGLPGKSLDGIVDRSKQILGRKPDRAKKGNRARKVLSFFFFNEFVNLICVKTSHVLQTHFFSY